MILADTSVWIDHFRGRDAGMIALLGEDSILVHPLVIQELACGHMPHREEVLELLARLPAAPLASHQEVLSFIVDERLHGSGIGAVDAHLLASARLACAALWSKDKALCRAAKRLGLSAARG